MIAGTRGVPVTPATVGTPQARRAAAAEIRHQRTAHGKQRKGFEVFDWAAIAAAESTARHLEAGGGPATAVVFADAWRLLADRRFRAWNLR